MNTQSDAMHGSFDVHKTAPTAMAMTRPFYWSVRRELWEYRSIYLAPLGVAAAYLVGFLISMIHLPGRMRSALAMVPEQHRAAIAHPFELAALLIMLAGFIVGIFYSLDALHSERRDRGILFWKSLPVSDLTTVLAKASIPIVVLQIITFAVTVALQWTMFLMSSTVVLANGLSVSALWTQAGLVPMWIVLFCHLMLLHGLSYAPIYGWLLMVSAWARRAPVLWAFLPLLVIGAVEKIVFNTSHFANMLGYLVMGGGDAFPVPGSGSMPMNSMPLHAVAEFFVSPELWIGLLFTVIFLAAAVRMRRERGPI